MKDKFYTIQLVGIGFLKLCIENKNTFDSQALIELKNEYCNKKRCLDCSIGNAILKNNTDNRE